MWWNRLLRCAAESPFDARFRPRLELSWSTPATPPAGPVAKLGGLPHWLDEPFWPVSATLGTPMMFVGQFPLPGEPARLAYLFLADDDQGAGLSFEPESGDNALIVQPGGRIPAFLPGKPAAGGPSLWRRGAQWSERVSVELELTGSPAAPETDALAERLATLQGTDHDEDPGYLEHRSYLGGRPLFWQPWSTDIGPDWRFFFQLDGAEGDGDYALNFGGGTGYAFLSEDDREGRFFWDCV